MASRSWAVWRAASRTYCETLIPCASAARAIVVYARSANRIVVACRATGGTVGAGAGRGGGAQVFDHGRDDRCDSVFAIAVAYIWSDSLPTRRMGAWGVFAQGSSRR